MGAKLYFIIPFAIFTISLCGYPSYHSFENHAAVAQPTISALTLPAQQLAESMGVRIEYPVANQEVPLGELNISGSSTDTASTDCNVLVDVNDIKPLQNTTASGPGGPTDYSKWNFTYTEKYKLITEGTNELTAKLSCKGNDSMNGTNSVSNITNGKSKWYSINVTGIAIQAPVEKTQNQTQSSNSTQKQEIAVSNDQESSASSLGDAKSQDDIAPEVEPSTEDQLQKLEKFNSSTELAKESIYKKESNTEETLAANDEHNDALVVGEESEQRELQPLQKFELKNEEYNSQPKLTDEDFQDVDSDEPGRSEPGMQTELQLPLSETNNQERKIAKENEHQMIQQDDDAQSAEDTYAMITSNVDKGNDLGDILKSSLERDSERDAEDLIAEEVQDYVRDIQIQIDKY